MSWEVNTLMAGPDPETAARDTAEVGAPALIAAGATEATCWLGLTGQYMGVYAMQSRWDSLDTFATAMRELGAKASSDTTLGDVMSRWTPQLRVVLAEVDTGGDCSGSHLMASRFSATSPLVGTDRSIALGLANGINGARILQAISGGEMTGQYIGSSYVDSLDTGAAFLAAAAADPQFQADARAAGLTLESRTLFARI